MLAMRFCKCEFQSQPSFDGHACNVVWYFRTLPPNFTDDSVNNYSSELCLMGCDAKEPGADQPTLSFGTNSMFLRAFDMNTLAP